jgi:hypothetical protein
MEEIRNAYKILVGKFEGLRPHVGPRRGRDTVFKKEGMKRWTGFSCLRVGSKSRDSSVGIVTRLRPEQ